MDEADQPIDMTEAAKMRAGQIYVTRDGGLATVLAPPAPAGPYVPLAEAPHDPIGRRVIWHNYEGCHHRGWYVLDSPAFGADIPGVNEASAQKVFVPLVAERTWWQTQLLPDFTPAPEAVTWVPIYRIWLDESEAPTNP